VCKARRPSFNQKCINTNIKIQASGWPHELNESQKLKIANQKNTAMSEHKDIPYNSLMTFYVQDYVSVLATYDQITDLQKSHKGV
jgi:hypothetical protein